MTTPEHAPSPIHFDTLHDYEVWASKYWVNTPGTSEAQQHARAKLNEEAQELLVAISSDSPEEIISEAGDVLWTAVATSSNAGISLTEELIEAFPDYFKAKNPLRTEELDTIAATLFEGISNKNVAEYLQDSQQTLGKATQQWFALGDTVKTPYETFADAWITVKREDAAQAVIMIALLTSYIAQHYADADLAAVISSNYQKIEARRERGASVTKPPRR